MRAYVTYKDLKDEDKTFVDEMLKTEKIHSDAERASRRDDLAVVVFGHDYFIEGLSKGQIL